MSLNKNWIIALITLFGSCAAASSSEPVKGSLLNFFLSHPNAFNGDLVNDNVVNIVKRRVYEPFSDHNLKQIPLQHFIGNLEDDLVQSAVGFSSNKEPEQGTPTRLTDNIHTIQKLSSDISVDVNSTDGPISEADHVTEEVIEKDTTAIVDNSNKDSLLVSSTTAENTINTETPNTDLKDAEEELRGKVAEIEAEPVILSARV